MDTYHELHRPQFHFSARENWINDPNGLVYKDGVWHLFFQHNPEATVWGNMTWGHAVSDDLIHWRQLEHVLYPDEHGTMFSGSAVVDHENTAGFGRGALLALYTAAGEFIEPQRPSTQCLAYSVDNGGHWTKYEGNPVVESFEKGNRDPKVIWHAGTQRWIMALYLADDRYCLLNSTDTKTWTRIQDLDLEGVSECPDFFPLNDESGAERWVFWGALGVYRIGSFDGTTFTPETERLVCERGRNGYAAQTWSDSPDGRRIQISWMAGGLFPEMPFNHQMSIPVELRLAGSGDDVSLVRWPVTEVASLRQRSTRVEHQVVKKGEPLVADTTAQLLDVSFSVHRQEAKSLYVMIRGQAMVFDWSSKELSLDGPTTKLMKDQSKVPLPDDAALSVRLLIDKTSVEVFLNQGELSASFCFLPAAYVDELVLLSYSGEQVVEDLEVHDLASIWS
jgi:fructan beta-fructosidase